MKFVRKVASEAKVDSAFFNGKAFGSVAQSLLAANMDVGVLRPYWAEDGKAYVTLANGQMVQVDNATLRKDEYLAYDKVLIPAVRDRLTGVQELYSRGLTYTIPNGLGSTVLAYEDQSDISDAEVSMDGAIRGRSDRPEFDLNYLPLPITSKNFEINARALAASRTTGAPLDTTMAELSARKIAEKLETMLFTGLSTYTFGGGIIYGFTDFPHRNTGSLTAAWSSATGAQIITDVKAMKQALINAKYYGPYVLFIPTDFETALDGNYSDYYTGTIRQRILQVNNVEKVVVADKLTASNVLMVQMTSDVVRMVNGLPVTTVNWDREGGMVHLFKIMTIQVPQLRADQNDACGVAHWS